MISRCSKIQEDGLTLLNQLTQVVLVTVR